MDDPKLSLNEAVRHYRALSYDILFRRKNKTIENSICNKLYAGLDRGHIMVDLSKKLYSVVVNQQLQWR